MNRLDIIKQAAEKAQMKKVIKDIDSRKAAIKEEMRLHKKLTKSVKKAEHQAPKSLEAFSEENLYYSDRETKDFLSGSSIMDTYEAMRSQDDY
tara:strand:+ start:3564 stop:3842 length:279 start_codon:yes stop_codon:yes gene_type:complete